MEKFKDCYWSTYTYTLEELTEKKLNGNDYDSGAVEAAGRTATNCSQFLGKLVNKLYEKKIFSFSDLEDLFTSIEREEKEEN